MGCRGGTIDRDHARPRLSATVPTEDPAARRWPHGRARLRSRHRHERWSDDRPTEDVPALAVTVALTVLGVGLLAGLAAWSPMAALIVATGLLIWSLLVEVTGNTVTSRLRTPLSRTIWVLLRPAYVLGFVVIAVVEGVVELVLG